MKRTKNCNGYVIYEAKTARDEETYNCHIGNFNIYTATDIRDFGLTNSYPEYEDIDSLAVALAMCSDSHYGVAVALADELSDSTVQDMDLTLEIERRLESGEALETIRRCYDRENGILYTSISDAIDHGYDPYANDEFDPYEDHPAVGYDEDGRPHIVEDECEWDEDDLDGDLEDVLETAMAEATENNWYVSQWLDESLRDELATGIGSDSTCETIEYSGLWGMAVLELGYGDIEVNVTRPEGDAICAEYFVCLKQADGEWFSHGYIDRLVTIDWSAPDWEDRLHQEMHDELLRYAAEQDWDLTTPFVEERDAAYAGLYAAEQYPVDPEPEEEPKQERRSHASYAVLQDPDDGQYYTISAPSTEGFDTQARRDDWLLCTVAKHHAFSDCGGYDVLEVVVDGRRVEYVGWQPGMLFEFVDCETDEIVWSASFPEWDH